MLRKSVPVLHAMIGGLLVASSVACFNGPSDSGPPDDLEVSEADGEIVAAHTDGVISRRSPLKIRFVDDAADPSALGAPIDAPYLFVEPETAGTLSWASARELVFDPEGDLTPGSTVHVTVDLGQIDEAWSGQAFAFDVEVMHQSVWTAGAGLSADAADGSTQKYSGTLRTADVADPKAAEAVLSATFAGERTPVTWTHDEAGTLHRYVVAGLARGEEAQTLEVRVNGMPLGVDSDKTETVTVPSIHTFVLASARAVTDAERYIELRFSDPLKDDQQLAGLITVEGRSGLRYAVDGSIVRVYSSTPWGPQETVRIEGLRNALDRQLPEALTHEVSFAAMAPQVRFASEGVILPSTTGQTVPIEVVNVRAIHVEARQVYDGNVPQFLQVNDLDGDQELSRVGQVVWRDRVDLELSPEQRNRWVRLGLDVSELVESNPAGLLHLSLSFERGDIEYDCATTPAPAADGPDQPLNPSWDQAAVEDSYWDNASEGMDWWELYENREDPCHPGYYTEHGDHDLRAERNVLVSDLGLLAKQGEDGLLFVVATDLGTATPRAGVTVEVLDFQLQALATGLTDSQGQARLTLAQGEAFVLRAVDEGDMAWLKLGRGNSLALSHFDVSGAPVGEGLKGFFYGERGVWRPGDDIHLMFVLHDTAGDLPDDHPIHVELRDPTGQLVHRRTVSRSVAGFYDLQTATAADAPTGTYLARVRVGGRSFDKALRVETVVPNRLKIDLDFGTDLIVAPDLAVDSVLTSRWLHGAKASNLDTAIEVRLKPAPTRFDRYSDFSFDDPTAQWSSETQELFRGTLDADGQVDVEAQIDVSDGAPGLLKATFLTRVFEPSGAASLDEATVTVSPHSRYVGLKLPKGDAARGMLLTDTQHPVQIVAVDAKGEPTGSGTVRVDMYKVSWRWWWETGTDDDLASYVGTEASHRIASGEVSLKDGQATWDFEVKYPDWGRYLIVVTDADGTHRAGQIVYVDWPGWAGRGQADNPGAASVLSVTTDDGESKVGDEVTLNIPTPKGGRALVTLETGTAVLSAAWVQPQGEMTQYSFQATAAMAPSVYANVTLVQPHLGDNDLPVRLYGIAPITVYDPQTKLEPVVQTADVLEPEATATVTVSEAQGRPMTYTLAVVDEGLLGLTRYKTPDPWGTFYAREALGVRTWDLFDTVMGGAGGSLESLIAIGGDGEAEAPPPAKANRFPPVVSVLGPFTLAKGASAQHAVPLPPYIGEVRVMVVAGHDGAYGSAERSVPVRKPLMVLPTLPRVVSPEERVALPVSVFALEEGLKDATVTVTTTGGLSVRGSSEATVSFPSPGDQMVLFDLQVAKELGIATVTVTAEGGTHRASQTIEIDVRHPGTRVVTAVGGTVDAGKRWTTDIELPGMAGSNELILELSRVPPLDLGSRLDGLIRYPHGCVEQTTSGAFPQVYLPTLLTLSSERAASVQHNVRSAITRLRRFQNAAGGFGYWPGEHTAHDWSSSYAGHFLMEAERAGYLLPGDMRSGWVSYQRDAANRWTASDPRDDLGQAYRLYTLALAGEPELGAMNRLRESRALSLAARWRLAAAYHLAGQPEVGRALVDGEDTDVAPYRELSNTFGSDLRDEAMILETLVLSGDTTLGMVVARRMSEALSSGTGMSTQTTAYLLVAMSRFATELGTGTEIDARYTVGDRGAQGVNASTPVVQVPLPEDGAKLVVENNGKGTLFVRVIASGLPPLGGDVASANLLAIDVEYQTATGATARIDELTHGSDIVARVTVRNSGASPADELALSHLVPSGWEIFGEAPGPGEGYDYRDVRDDRVYTYFDLAAGESRTFTVGLNASYRGRFYMPPVSVEAMYDPIIQARTAGQWVQVVLGSDP